MWTDPWVDHQCPKPGQGEQIHGGVGRSICQLLLGLHTPNVLKMFLKHKGTLLDYLRGVDTPMDRVPAPKTGMSWANTWGSGEVNISVAIRALYTKFFWEVSERHRDISRPLRRCWHTHGQSASAQHMSKLSKYMGEWGGQYVSFY